MNSGIYLLMAMMIGVLTATYLPMNSSVARDLGSRQLRVLSIAGQLTMAMIISHLGIFETPKDPITLKKVVGALLLFAGVVVSVN